jgi:hypothetical protein
MPSSVSSAPPRRHHLRQEPDAVIPLVRIRGGAREQSRFLLRCPPLGAKESKEWRARPPAPLPEQVSSLHDRLEACALSCHPDRAKRQRATRDQRGAICLDGGEERIASRRSFGCASG